VKDVLLVVIFIISFPQISTANDTTLITLQHQAKQLKLADKRLWQRLLHYQTDLTSFKKKA
jgi:hypothetical protein